MRDQFERNINYMRVSVTDLCNLRCVYCMPKEGIRQISHDEILTFDEIARVCRIGAELGISRIKLTGDSYVTSLDDADTDYSNIDFNGYTLYANGTAINK